MLFFSIIGFALLLILVRFFILVNLLRVESVGEVTSRKERKQPVRVEKPKREGFISRFITRRKNKKKEKELRESNLDIQLGLEEPEYDNSEDNYQPQSIPPIRNETENDDLTELEDIKIGLKTKDDDQGRISERYPELLGVERKESSRREEPRRQSLGENKKREAPDGEPRKEDRERTFDTGYRGIGEATKSGGNPLDELNRAERELSSSKNREGTRRGGGSRGTSVLDEINQAEREFSGTEGQDYDQRFNRREKRVFGEETFRRTDPRKERRLVDREMPRLSRTEEKEIKKPKFLDQDREDKKKKRVEPAPKEPDLRNEKEKEEKGVPRESSSDDDDMAAILEKFRRMKDDIDNI